MRKRGLVESSPPPCPISAAVLPPTRGAHCRPSTQASLSLLPLFLGVAHDVVVNSVLENKIMQRFLTRHAAKVAGVLSGFDRVLFRGMLMAICHVRGMDRV